MYVHVYVCDCISSSLCLCLCVFACIFWTCFSVSRAGGLRAVGCSQDACSAAGLSGGVNVEEVVLENAFSIIFMLDELISFGLREAVTLAQIRTYTDMDSHEEKLQRIITEV